MKTHKSTCTYRNCKSIFLYCKSLYGITHYLCWIIIITNKTNHNDYEEDFCIIW